MTLQPLRASIISSNSEQFDDIVFVGYIELLSYGDNPDLRIDIEILLQFKFLNIFFVVKSAGLLSVEF